MENKEAPQHKRLEKLTDKHVADFKRDGFVALKAEEVWSAKELEQV